MNYREHKLEYRDCRKCILCGQRRRMVFARGNLPAPILFIGEAPGAGEDTLGIPFVGPAGKLLDKILGIAIDGQVDYAITNLVCCYPKDAKATKNHVPPKEAIQACSARLADFIVLCQPDIIVTVGKLSDKWVPYVLNEWINWDGVLSSIIHPASILRMDQSQQSLAMRRSIATLEDVTSQLKEMNNGEENNKEKKSS